MSVEMLARPGTLVHARGREWVVLPESTETVLMVRPVGGLDEEVVGILPAIEQVRSATFSLPAKADLGDFTSGRLLRDAARLSTRAAAGPFRSFGRIAVEPRPYQLVPLMMALKLDPVRLLIADDVGIGKTIEAATIARELLDRGEIRRMAVLCPPHLAEQWQTELSQKFHIEAELVLSTTIRKLEADHRSRAQTVFERHPFTVVSTDFIKSERHRESFLRTCPEFVIVDEAHGCTVAGGAGKGRQMRYELVSGIARDASRHVVLVTATPHSGNEEAFRSLLGLLDSDFLDLPHDLEKKEREGIRRKLARHLVQRRRADIRHYLDADTAFPERLDKESTYTLGDDYRRLFEDILEFARDYVAGDDGERHQRVRYWSALALLRCVSSSPAAAAATLRSRAAVDEAEAEEVEDVGRRTVLDQDAVDEVATLDFNPGSRAEDSDEATRRKLLEFARRAEALSPEQDHKLQGAIKEIKALVKDGFQPVVFCRFIDTAEYLAKHLRDALPKVRIESVTGLLPSEEREARIRNLATDDGQFVLVCTDCLSEGINLQHHFNAVMHYDLAWNPTRHEQREGRVDRFGQPRPEVRVVTYYGKDNPIDGVILDVLLRKHKNIKSDLGVAVAVPGSSEQVAEALFQGALFREKTRGGGSRQMRLDFIDELDLGPKKRALHAEWESARDRERVTRSRFAQHTLSPEAVAAELASVRDAIGRSEDVEVFLSTVLKAANVPLTAQGKSVKVTLSPEVPRALRQAIGRDDSFAGKFELPIDEGELYLGRTSPIVEGLAGWALDQALDPVARDARAVASRCGVISTSKVATRTTLLVARFRYHLQVGGASGETLLCEEIVPLACTGAADAPVWLTKDEGEQLLTAKPERNLISTLIEQQIELLTGSLPKFQGALAVVAKQRAQAQLEAHERVREAARTRGKVTVAPVLPVDILGAYVLLPKL